VPNVGVYDGLMQRYNGTSYADWEYTPETFLDELFMWIAGESDAESSRKKAGVKPGEEDIRTQALNAGLPLS
jgi:hypothetical protein